jgi:hypothetical protein
MTVYSMTYPEIAFQKFLRIPYCDISLHFLFDVIKTNDSKKFERIIEIKWRHGAQNTRQLVIYNLRLNLKVKINETEKSRNIPAFQPRNQCDDWTRFDSKSAGMIKA